jgi:dipeptidyl aminopeptidase/acylaminoacyl peptidase
LELETVNGAVGLAWSPDGERLAFTAGAEVWEVTATGEATLRRRFGFLDPRWDTLEWSPDGSGVLATLDGAYERRLYWFPASGGEPVLLVAGDDVGSARWSSRNTGTHSGPGERPPMVVIERSGYEPRLHFVGPGSVDLTVRARGASHSTPFQVAGQRVYYYMRYVERRRVLPLPVPDASDHCEPPLASPDGARLAWLCSDGPPDWQELVDGRAEVRYRLVVTDGRGRDPREVWHHVETGPHCRSVRLLRWQSDGEVVYLSRPRVGAAWAHFDYNPGVTAIDVNTGQVTQVGDLEAVHDARVSPDGTWLAQSMIRERREEGACTIVRSLPDGTERTVACAAGVRAAGDFSFSPDDRWLAWREWMKAPGGARMLIRALRVPQGEPFTVVEAADDEAPRIGGWLSEEQLVLVYPRLTDGSGGYSTVLSLPATGPGTLFSPFEFLGVLDDAR